MCAVDINPLANCTGCIFGRSEPKSIPPVSHLSCSIFYLLLSSIASKRTLEPFEYKRYTCVKACVFRYLCMFILVCVTVHPMQWL